MSQHSSAVDDTVTQSASTARVRGVEDEVITCQPSDHIHAVSTAQGCLSTMSHSTGVTESLAAEITESRSTGVTESLAAEITESRSTGVTESLAAGVTESRSTGVTESLAAEITESLSSEVTESRSTGVTDSACVDQSPSRAIQPTSQGSTDTPSHDDQEMLMDPEMLDFEPLDTHVCDTVSGTHPPGPVTQEGEEVGADGDSAEQSLEEGEISDEDEDDKRLLSEARSVCRFFNKGQCTWGVSCRFLHPGVTDKGNYNMFAPVNSVTIPNTNSSTSTDSVSHPTDTVSGAKTNDMSSAQSQTLSSTTAAAAAIGTCVISAAAANIKADTTVDRKPPNTAYKQEVSEIASAPVYESAWERGMREAKERVRRASKRRLTDADFEEKRMNMRADSVNAAADTAWDVSRDRDGGDDRGGRQGPEMGEIDEEDGEADDDEEEVMRRRKLSPRSVASSSRRGSSDGHPGYMRLSAYPPAHRLPGGHQKRSARGEDVWHYSDIWQGKFNVPYEQSRAYSQFPGYGYMRPPGGLYPAPFRAGDSASIFEPACNMGGGGSAIPLHSLSRSARGGASTGSRGRVAPPHPGAAHVIGHEGGGVRYDASSPSEYGRFRSDAIVRERQHGAVVAAQKHRGAALEAGGGKRSHRATRSCSSATSDVTRYQTDRGRQDSKRMRTKHSPALSSASSRSSHASVSSDEERPQRYRHRSNRRVIDYTQKSHNAQSPPTMSRDRDMHTVAQSRAHDVGVVSVTGGVATRRSLSGSSRATRSSSRTSSTTSSGSFRHRSIRLHKRRHRHRHSSASSSSVSSSSSTSSSGTSLSRSSSARSVTSLNYKRPPPGSRVSRASTQHNGTAAVAAATAHTRHHSAAAKRGAFPSHTLGAILPSGRGHGGVGGVDSAANKTDSRPPVCATNNSATYTQKSTLKHDAGLTRAGLESIVRRNAQAIELANPSTITQGEAPPGKYRRNRSRSLSTSVSSRSSGSDTGARKPAGVSRNHTAQQKAHISVAQTRSAQHKVGSSVGHTQPHAVSAALTHRPGLKTPLEIKLAGSLLTDSRNRRRGDTASQTQSALSASQRYDTAVPRSESGSSSRRNEIKMTLKSHVTVAPNARVQNALREDSSPPPERSLTSRHAGASGARRAAAVPVDGARSKAAAVTREKAEAVRAPSSSKLSRREELMKQLRAVEDAITRKRSN